MSRILRSDYSATVTYSATSTEGGFSGGLSLEASRHLAALGATIAVQDVALSDAVLNVNTVQDAVKRLFNASPADFAKRENQLHGWVEHAYDSEVAYRCAPRLFCRSLAEEAL